MADPTFSDLSEACSQPGCPICRLVRRAVEHFVQHMLYENVNDIPLRAQLRQNLGMCHTHAWLLLEPDMGDALGTAIIYNDVFTNILRHLPEPINPSPKMPQPTFLQRFLRTLTERVKAARQALTPQGVCPACKQQDIYAHLSLAVLVKALQGESQADVLAKSDGLCLSHLDQAFSMAHDVTVYNALVNASRKRYEILQGELAEFIRKNDYRFRGESFGSEGDSWRRVIGVSVGGRWVFPRRVE
jgi:hypothetical protein